MITTACADASCGVEFSIPDHIWNQVRRLGNDRWVYCPNGHRSHWTKSEADELREKIASLQTTITQKAERIDELFQMVERRDRTIAYWKGIAHRKRK